MEDSPIACHSTLCMDLFYHENIPLDLITDQFAGCNCQDDCTLDGTCSCLAQFPCSYSSGKLTNFDQPIFECNSNCQCSPECPNRLVQRHLAKLLNSSPAPNPNLYLDLLQACPTDNGMGQKLVARQQILPNSLVCVYLGEVIPSLEAFRRESEQLRTKGHNYVLVMRELTKTGAQLNEICIDGDSDVLGPYKPLTRLINHSCDPNLVVMPVHVDNLVPYLALFSSRMIQKGEEVTYNYAQSVPVDQVRMSSTRCLCGSSNCMGFLPRI